jgi:protein ImuB
MTSMIVCVLVPRFPLVAVTRGQRELLMQPAALAPSGGQRIGEVTGAAEGLGIRAGMRLSEALARCPELVLLAPDPERTESAWEESIHRLEGIGAAVESERPGEAFFAADGLRGLLGGRVEGVMSAARRAIRAPARLGAAPTGFCAYAAARQARPRARMVILAGAARTFLAGLPVSLLRERLPEGDDLAETLWRLGVRTLGELAALPRDDVADRFGADGLRALDLIRGNEPPLRPRSPREELTAGLELPEGAFGPQLERALSLLIDRLLAHPARRGRSLRRVRLAARLASGGGWRADATLREASVSSERLGLALAPKLSELPGPALALELRVLSTGSPPLDQLSLTRSPSERRRMRLAEAVRQARAAAGRDAILRVLEIDPDSRVPERRAALAPFPEPQE